MAETAENRKLPVWYKLVYGSGDIGKASFNTLRMLFYAIFLTDVVGLDPRLASFASLVSILWDAINDPIVGSLSDNVRTRWGRRRPFLLVFTVPFALGFLLLWWAPPWESQVLLMLTIMGAYMITDTLQTLVSVPYMALTPEIADDYDERTSLTTFRMMWNLIASLLTAAVAPAIVDSVVASGASLQQGYLLVAAIFGGSAILPFLLIFFVVREKEVPPVTDVHQDPITLKSTLQEFLQNTPFKFATGIYVFNWIAFDTVSLMLPFFLLYWVASGDLLAQVDLFGMKIGLETIALGTMFGVAILTLPLWNWLSQRLSKKVTYIIGLVLWIIVEALVLTVQPGQHNYMLVLCVVVGFFTSNAHIIPEAMFPDVIDWAELKTNHRREGAYYGAINLIRKLATAVASFIALQVLGWTGYTAPDGNTTIFSQPASALTAIRILTGPLIIIFLLVALWFTTRYPLTRDRQHQIRRSLERRQRRANRRAKRQAESQS
ncbi:MAG: glycoside-pentoside-hexuronide (GPH):cation symporter [Anaerolineae bacterium]|jgi:GPH family glycoside/pentoside/hexuronide:cation symporter|nr:glycoside-pentoside-hexuronide (GPH):cation symporter [Anaerolineae bacterium]